MPAPTFVTIAGNARLPRALALRDSLRAAYGTRAELVLLYLGDPALRAEVEGLGPGVVLPEELGLPELWDLGLRYGPDDLKRALAPFLLGHVLRARGARSAILLDAATLVRGRLDRVRTLLEGGLLGRGGTASLVLVRRRPGLPGEGAAAGAAIDGRFAAVDGGSGAAEVLRWWADQVTTGALPCPLDLAPALFEGVRVLDPDRLGGALAWPGEPASDHAARWAEAARALPSSLRDGPDRFDALTDGSPVPAIVREAYARRRPPRPAARETLFSPGLEPVMAPSAEVPGFHGVEMSDLYVALHRGRRDLHRFDLARREGQVAYLAWIADHGAGAGLPERAVEPARRLVAAEEARGRPLGAFRARLGTLHEAVLAGRAGPDDLLAEAARLVGALAAHDGDAAPAVADAAGLFRAVESLARRTLDRLGRDDLGRLLALIEENGRYLASKHDLTYPAFLEAAPPRREPAAEADAVRNACFVLAELFEHRIRAEVAGIRTDAALRTAEARRRPLAAARPEGGPRVVWVSGEPHTPGHVYRVARQAEAAEMAGARATWLRLDEVEGRLAEIAAADLVVIWRAPWDDAVALVVEMARKAGAGLVFDVDDLVFDPALANAEIVDGIRSSNASVEAVREHYARFRRTLLACDAALTTTEELAAALGEVRAPCFVVPNGFDAATVDASRRAALDRRAAPDDGLVRIGYASGSLTHQRDFAEAADALGMVLRERPQARLVLLRDPRPNIKLLDEAEFPALAGLEGRIEWRDYVPLRELPHLLAGFDVNIAPLEVGNPFCEAKSELKFFEAALVGVPSVASPTGPFRRAIRDGASGFLAADPGAWREALLRLVDDPALRRSMAEAARGDAVRDFGPERRARALRALFDALRPAGTDGARPGAP